MRVLIVEDEPTHLELIEAILLLAGFTCQSAVNGKIAPACLMSEGFDSILQDEGRNHPDPRLDRSGQRQPGLLGSGGRADFLRLRATITPGSLLQ
ncbi:MAG TPA: hypothetical protein DD435_06700 [Cyanobacteria bacterium UBA8530]|nr:hypothetical protein [Cyanobacteria bacterium UBA8530]